VKDVIKNHFLIGGNLPFWPSFFLVCTLILLRILLRASTSPVAFDGIGISGDCYWNPILLVFPPVFACLTCLGGATDRLLALR
jgi:hypothetical protein